jgi:hypothetical protein
VGHAYTTIAADTVTRARRLRGRDAFLLTGTDEHGQNIERIARERGIPEQQQCDEISAKFTRAVGSASTSANDDFIRTTEDRHKRGSLYLWESFAPRRLPTAGPRSTRELRRLVLPALRELQGRRRADPAGEHLSRPRAPVRVDWRRRTSSSGSPRTQSFMRGEIESGRIRIEPAAAGTRSWR